MGNIRHVKALPIIEYSGYKPKPGKIPFAKKHQYFIVTDVAMTGDAPKDFIAYYHYREGRKDNRNSWPRFIAKHGHKHYPMEVITEYLLNRIGEELGFNMAKSELAWFGGQIRFLSKYFLDNPQRQVLEHGADLYSGYLNDRDFVEEVEKKNQSPAFFTVQFTKTTLDHFFPEESEILMFEFLKLLLFDAIIGNNDRHFYNWGIIQDLKGKNKPIFSPIYDTARGLFWNDHEDKLKQIIGNKARFNTFIKKYTENSSPKVGWEGKEKINHFELVEEFSNMGIVNKNQLFFRNVLSEDSINRVIRMVGIEFDSLISNERKDIIFSCLTYRFDRIKKIFNFAQ